MVASFFQITESSSFEEREIFRGFGIRLKKKKLHKCPICKLEDCIIQLKATLPP